MKLARLLLEAFGPFTDKVLDFGEGAALHLVHGPNEAGKSSALRAITDLRFGIPHSSADDFVHPYNRMRIAGIFVDEHGRQIGLRRRKGRGQTLSAIDPVSGAEIPTAIESGIENALSGGLSRDEFELLFGLDHARLRAAGRRLLEGEGEVGSALFDASTGIRNVGELLDRLDADARSYYLSRGNAQNAVINQALRELQAHRQALRAATTRPAEWQALKREHERADEALRALETRLEQARRSQNELTELRIVEPLLRELDLNREALAALAEVPELAPDARDQRLAAEQALRGAQQDRVDAEVALARCDAELATIQIDAPLLEHARAIERLAGLAEQVGDSRVQRRLHDDRIAQLEAELHSVAARIAPTQTPDSLLQAAPSSADRVALGAHLEAIARADVRLGEQRAQREALDAAQHAHAAETPALPDPDLRRALKLALEDARALGDVSRQRADAEGACRALERQRHQALSDLGLASVGALRATRPLLDAQVVATRDALASVDDHLNRLRDEAQRLEVDLQTQRRRQRELAAAGEVVTAETLRQARARRDEGWLRVRKAFIERSHDAAELAHAFDPTHRLPEAFEAAQTSADRQADLLRADAGRAASYEECSTRIHDMQLRLAEIEADAVSQREAHARLNEEWLARLAAAGLPSLAPEAMREWAMQREAAVALAEQHAQAAARLQAMDEATEHAEQGLRTALVALGQAAAERALAQLVRLADELERTLARRELEAEARARESAEQAHKRERIARRIEETELERAGHQRALADWHARLALAPDSTAETVQARLAELDALIRHTAELSAERQRRAEHHARIEEFEAQTAALAIALGEATPTPALAVDRVGHWKANLASAQDAQRRQEALRQEHARLVQDKTAAVAIEHAQQAILAALCAAAGVATPAALPACEEAATRKRALRAALAAHEQRLAQASTRPEAALRSRLEGTDAPALEHELARCRTEITRLTGDVAEARIQEERRRRALETIDASSAAAEAREGMESAAACLRAALRPWARLKLAHMLLEESLARFRERAQAPMVAVASTYFALMTGARYPSLVVDDTQHPPVLRAKRADGQVVGVEGLSEGTRDQLFLALRLAALELRRATPQTPMPLVLDDVLVTSDDTRAANVLRALARFAAGGQVLLFTHHPHLVEVARGALGEEGVRVVEL